MSEETALLKIIGLILTVGIWGYCNFSNHPDIVKNRNATQKWINTGVALVVIYFIVTGIQ